MMSSPKDGPRCGLVMPISKIEDCSESHWLEVRSIHEEAIEAAGFSCLMVSEDVDVGVIHKRIIQNLYDNEIVLVDISARNPNVMFELGMRLAFDKPIVIVKDDKTPYSFDTSPIEHLTYPRDLRFQAVVDFKEQLTQKLQAAHASSGAFSFLKSFGSFKVAEIPTENAKGHQIILEELDYLKSSIRRIEMSSRRTNRSLIERREDTPSASRLRMLRRPKDCELSLCFHGPETKMELTRGALRSLASVDTVETTMVNPRHYHFDITLVNSDGDHEIKEMISKFNEMG